MTNNALLYNIQPEQVVRAGNPPHDINFVETLHGVPVSDPFRPMEDFKSAATLDWVAQQNLRFDNFTASAQHTAEETIQFFKNAIPKGMRESMPIKKRDKYFVWRRQEGDARPSYFVKDVPDYDAPARCLLNPLEIDPSGKTNVVGISPTKDGKILAYQLSVSGSDETTLKFMDVETGADLGESYSKFRSGVTWGVDARGFYYRRPVEGLEKAHEVCYHAMGTNPASDLVIYSPSEPETSASYFRLQKNSTKEPGLYEYLLISNTDRDKNAILKRPLGSDIPFETLFPFKEGELSPIHEIDGTIYATTSLGAGNNRLVAIDPQNPAPENWQTILSENQDPLMNAFVWQNKIFATYGHDTGEVLKVYDLAGNHLHDVPTPPLSTFALGQVRMDDTTCLLTYDSFQETGTIYKYDSTANQLTVFRESKTPINLRDCKVERHFATSKDGTKVPMTIIYHPDTKLDGTAATLLYGYGGFDVALSPGFDTDIAQWVRAGGIYVMSNLRGGGEFGKDWYDAGRKENKQNVFNDFAACAEYLIENNFTSSKRLAIQGGSNGGLLTLVTMLQRPELFGAVISEVPVSDMFRFHIGSYYGYGWKHDYGDPDIREDFNHAAAYSPLHNVLVGFEHPPLLINTDLHDDRVLPWHSFKMAATLQCLEDDASLTLLKVRTDGGHGAGQTEQQKWADTGALRAFLHQTLGPIDQDAYKATLAVPAIVQTTTPV
ncbi:MAG: prolyl oligopeptidase family serine peptidase [Alphaproteobacteria bacterium]|nr:prolyl oligopeptidase family serine peptidase [Alphaproteobacteria bacterium]